MKAAAGKKACRVCEHPERGFLDKLLEQGFSPRAIVKRVGGVTRKGLARHRDACLAAKSGEKEELGGDPRE